MKIGDKVIATKSISDQNEAWEQLERRAFAAETQEELEAVYNSIPDSIPEKFQFYNAFSDRRFFLPKAQS